jgi:hypothetical protein
MKEIIKDKYKAILSVINQDIGKRGIDNLLHIVKDDLYNATYSIFNKANPHICIITGFFIHDSKIPSAETDGIVGAAHLARAFTNIGINVSILTDTLCSKAVKSALEGCNVEIVTPIQQVPVGKTHDEYDEIIDSIKKKWTENKNPITHVISIERAGISYDGNIYNMSAKNISKYTVPFDKLFLPNKEYTRISIGDGGNEIGMGKLSHQIISENVKFGEFIACKTSCDYLIISGISNWGAYGLIALYSLLLDTNKKELFLKDFNIETDNAILINAVKKGNAVDGITKKNELSIDGINQETNLVVLNNILEIIGIE